MTGRNRSASRWVSGRTMGLLFFMNPLGIMISSLSSRTMPTVAAFSLSFWNVLPLRSPVSHAHWYSSSRAGAAAMIAAISGTVNGRIPSPPSSLARVIFSDGLELIHSAVRQ